MQDAFLLFITKISLYPTLVFTGLVMFVTLYWIVSLLGMVDMDSVDVGDSADISEVSSAGFFSGLLLKFGLYGVPLIIILTLISLIGWLLSYVYTSLLHDYISSGILYWVFGTGALLLVLVVSMWLTGLIIAPIRKNIAKIPKRNAISNIGKTAIVRTLSVTDKHGEAQLSDGGAGLILKIRPDSSEQEYSLKQGDKVVLVEYLAEANTYRVERVKD
ncbi:OB-fold-containig protein [uncultured Psychrobacter sp.]|uniref:OB-fold-containig protein n=2 Tax=unclassified Psychrobacter TaxID=196806 RepID=UPI00293D2A46|nr:OB-fold-containig protein [uncultured Psychrobacter sp.]